MLQREITFWSNENEILFINTEEEFEPRIGEVAMTEEMPKLHLNRHGTIRMLKHIQKQVPEIKLADLQLEPVEVTKTYAQAVSEGHRNQTGRIPYRRRQVAAVGTRSPKTNPRTQVTDTSPWSQVTETSPWTRVTDTSSCFQVTDTSPWKQVHTSQRKHRFNTDKSSTSQSLTLDATKTQESKCYQPC